MKVHPFDIGFLCFVIVGIFTSCSTDRVVKPPEAVLPVPSEAQLKWHQMEINAFIHFTTNTFTGREWGFGDESPAVFNPTDIDVQQWMKVLKETGFRGVILTAKHHDGFCLWPSSYTEHSVKNSAFRRDVVKMVSDAARDHNLKFGIYLSPWDRNHPQYGTPAYIDYYRNQLTELFRGYGPVFEMWFDGANGGDGYYGGVRETRKIDGASYYEWPGTLAMVREMEPDVIFFSDAGPGVRWVGNERGVAGDTNWNTITPDTLFAGKAGINNLLTTGSETGTHWIPAEADVSIRPGWFYHAEEDSLVKSGDELFGIYLTSVGRGSTLLLNVPPDRRGRFHDRDVAALQSFRQKLDDAFGINLASNATATAVNNRGDSQLYSAMQATDNNPDTYFATDDDTLTADIIIDLGEEKMVKFISLQEYIRLGQRVKRFSVYAWKNAKWESIGEGTTVGYKRILQLDPVTTGKIRVAITDAKACPLISEIALF